MTCEEARRNLVESLLERNSDLAATAHIRKCGACARYLESLRKTLALLDEWKTPQPSAYFLRRLYARVRRELYKSEWQCA